MEAIEFKSELKNMSYIQQFIEDISDAYSINDTYFGNVLIALNEAVKNAILHGNKSQSTKKVKVSFWEEKNQLNFIVSDEGEGFNFRNLPNPIENENEGRGLFLMHTLADKVEFSDNGKSVHLNFILQGINTELGNNRIRNIMQYTRERVKKTSL